MTEEQESDLKEKLIATLIAWEGADYNFLSEMLVFGVEDWLRENKSIRG